MKNFKLLMESWRGFTKKTLSERVETNYGESFEGLRDIIELSRDKVWIFFDTETTGLKPDKDYNQITQIAAIAVDVKGFDKGSEPVIIGKFNEKIALGDRTKSFMGWEKEKEAERAAAGEESKFKTIPQIFAMTGYGEPKNPRKRLAKGLTGAPKNYGSMQEVMQNFAAFCEQYPNRVLVAQNAPFDVNYVNEMFRRFDLEPPADVVMDTVKVFQKFLAPAVKKIKGRVEVGEEVSPEDKAILDALTAQSATRGPYITVSLGKLIDAFKVQNEGWHDALADVVMLSKVLRAVLHWLDDNEDVKSVTYPPPMVGPETEPPPPRPRAGKASDVE